MINVILIDDERTALRELEYMLSDYKDVAIVGKYTNPITALKEIEDIEPQIVFLDINMPQMNGMELANKIIISSPNIDIIFVTACETYAVQAFDIYAMDYLVKPIKKERLEKSVHRVRKKYGRSTVTFDRKLLIKCFGEFKIYWENEEPIKWRTEKTKELFALLLHNHGKVVSKHQIIDAVWPDIDPDKAEHQLYNGIYYIRKKLNDYRVPRECLCLNGNYCLKMNNVDLDVLHFNEYLNKNIKMIPIKILKSIEEEYVGEYFENYDWPWASYDRHNYSRKYYEIAFMLSDIYIQNYEFDKAERLLEKIIRINPYDEKSVLLLMKTYLSKNNKMEAKRLYDDYCKTLKYDLGILPSNDLKNIYNMIEN